MAELDDIDGLGPARSESLEEAGYRSVRDLAEADPERVAEEANVPEDTALSFVVQAQNQTDTDVENAEVDAEEVDEEDTPEPADLAEREEDGDDTYENRDEDEIADANADTSEDRGPDAEGTQSEEEVETSEEEEEGPYDDEDREVADADATTSEDRGPDADEEGVEGGAEEDDGPYDEDREVTDADATTSENRGPDADDEDDASRQQEDTGEEETYEVSVDFEDDVHHDAYLVSLMDEYKRRYGSDQQRRDALQKVIDDARYSEGGVTHELTEYELNQLHAAVSQQTNEFKGHNMIEEMDAANDLLEQINEVRQEELF